MRILDQGRITETHINLQTGEATGQFLGVFSFDEKPKIFVEYPIYATEDWARLIGIKRQHKVVNLRHNSLSEKRENGKTVVWVKAAQ